MDSFFESLVLQQMPVLVMNSNHILSSWNQELEKLYGWTQQEALGKDAHRLLKTVFPLPIDQMEHQLFEHGKWTGELIRTNKDGEKIYLSSHSVVQRNEQGGILTIYELDHDITKQKQAEQRVHEANRFAQDTIDAIKAHICVLAENGNILNVNQAWRDFADANPPAPANSCIGMNYLDVCDRAVGLNSAEAIPFAAGLRAVIKGDLEQFTMEYPCNDPNKEKRWFSAQITQFAAGNPQRIVVAHENITGRKLAELKIAEYTALLRSLSQRQSELQEIERRNIARELHDEVGQVMTAVKTNLETIKLSPVPATLNHQLVESIRIVDRALDQIRTIALNLRPSLLDDFGLEAALEWYLDRLARGTSYIIKFKSNMSEMRLPPVIETTCFRVAQAAMTNISRHSQAARVDVSLHWYHKAKTVKLSVRDNGIGFNVTAALERARHGESLGLLGMQERVQLVGGQIEFVSAPGRGTKVLVSIPVIAEA